MLKLFYKKIFSEKIRIDIRIQLNKLIAPIYYGNKLKCNCCDKEFRTFLPKGNIKRENAQCPYCGSLERTRLLHLYLKNETTIFKNHLRVLHFAPERCLYDIFKKLDIDYIDGDINPAYASKVIDATNIDYPDSYFDLIICSHVLGHIPDEKKALREINRVMKKNGTALIQTLINRSSEKTFEDPKISSAKDRLSIYGEVDLVRLHGLDFSTRLELQGFQVESIDYRQNVSQSQRESSSLGDGNREMIFKCTK